MKIRLNGAWRELAGAADSGPADGGPADGTDAGSCSGDPPNAALTLAAVLERLGYGGSLVATALNGEFVPVRERGGVSVRDGDRLEVLAPMQGG
jgi:sulfur carrier protein